MLHKMYIATRPIVIAFAQERNTFVTPKISTHTNASTCTPTSRWIALIGVLRFGLTFPRAVGSTPDRPMAYQVRVPPLKHAMDKAMAEFSSAKSSSTHAPPHTRCASGATGKAALGLVMAAIGVFTPMPTRYPQVPHGKKLIRMKADP